MSKFNRLSIDECARQVHHYTDDLVKSAVRFGELAVLREEARDEARAEVGRLRARQPDAELVERAREALEPLSAYASYHERIRAESRRSMALRDLLAAYDAPEGEAPEELETAADICAHHSAVWTNSFWAWNREDGEHMGQHPGLPCPTCEEPMPPAPCPRSDVMFANQVPVADCRARWWRR